MADTADLNLDELRRRGRRRLIGAIVLALVAAVVVPMLLESDPRPLGEDVSVRIPAVDDGKFVNKLTPPPPKDAAPATSAPPAPAVETAPRKSVADAEKSVMTPPAKAPAAAKAPAKAPEPAKAAAPGQATAAATAPATAPAEPTREGFVVQLAAFSDDKGANALSGKLTRAGYPAYTETITTSRGTLWRVRVGGYPTRDAAGAARDKLKAEGHAGIVVPAK
jgi:DedD protein